MRFDPIGIPPIQWSDSPATPWSKTAGTGATPVEMEAGDGPTSSPAETKGALGPGRGTQARGAYPLKRTP